MTATPTRFIRASIVNEGKVEVGDVLKFFPLHDPSAAKKLEKIYAEERRGARLPVIERWPGKNIVPGGHRPGL